MPNNNEVEGLPHDAAHNNLPWTQQRDTMVAQMWQHRGSRRWTPVISSFVLKRFVDLVGGGVKTNKSFKEVHVNQVAKSLSEFCNQEVTGTQVYNHLRKWRQRWMKVCRLKDLSGATWDENTYSIILDDDHLVGHTKVNYQT